ncbi:MAG: sigma-70 family RNA polymerase sigma factor [Bacteroidales bacterium]|nr:sigma-70 family RNA polymerase sigma factor [Bacteroidales bacterium]
MTQDALLNTLLSLQPALQLAAEKLLHSSADAEDTVQEVVIELWEKRDDLRHVRNLEGYALQTVRNRCLSLLRKQHDIASGNLEMLTNLSDEAIIAEAALVEERAAQLDRMMEHLPQVQREAVKMKYLKEMSHQEMQRQLGMSSANVYTTLSRAISNLKTMMSHGR